MKKDLTTITRLLASYSYAIDSLSKKIFKHDIFSVSRRNHCVDQFYDHCGNPLLDSTNHCGGDLSEPVHLNHCGNPTHDTYRKHC